VQADRPSRTASFVAMGRALAHAHAAVPGFRDPFALQLLPEDDRAAVERVLRHERPRTRREATMGIVARATEPIMGTRTVEIDEGLRALAPGFQLVILGAGLDARAYRMPELSTSVVFEVDHPASQAFKLRQAAGLRPVARELRHVSVDFARERVEDALARAGHATNVPTAWIFEGVITYLTRSEIGSSLDAMAQRSAPGSRLLATYNEQSVLRRVFSRVTMRSSEPHRTTLTPGEMRALLEQRGFVVCSDRDGVQRAYRWGIRPTAMDRFGVRFHHVVIADYLGTRATRA